MNPRDLKYSEEHEWLSVESDGSAAVGITEFAADSLGDIVFVELPEVGTELTRSEKMGEIESVKAVSELYTPVSGRVVELNEKLSDSPELVNDGPYESGWMIKVTLNDPSETELLLSADQYESFLAAQEQ